MAPGRRDVASSRRSPSDDRSTISTSTVDRNLPRLPAFAGDRTALRLSCSIMLPENASPRRLSIVHREHDLGQGPCQYPFAATDSVGAWSPKFGVIGLLDDSIQLVSVERKWGSSL